MPSLRSVSLSECHRKISIKVRELSHRLEWVNLRFFVQCIATPIANACVKPKNENDTKELNQATVTDR